MPHVHVQPADPLPFENLSDWEALPLPDGAPDLDPAEVWRREDGWRPDGRTLIWDDETTIVWFRQRWTVPARWAGSVLLLAIEVRNGQTVYVDGEPVGGRHVLTANAEAGRTFRFALRGDRGRRPGMIMRTQVYRFPPGHDRWIRARQTIAELMPGAGLLLDCWRVREESNGENLADPAIEHSDWPIYKLGKEWRERDSCTWFRARIIVPDAIDGFPTTGQPLRLTAMFNHRGSIWVDGEQRAEYARNYGDAVVAESAQPGTEHTLAVRVPTSWSGWLRETRLLPQSLADAIASWRALADELEKWDRFLRVRPDEEYRETVLDALSPLDVSERTGPAVGSAMRDACERLTDLSAQLASDAPFVALPYLQLPRPDGVTVRAESLFDRTAALRLVHPDGAVTVHRHDEPTRFHRFALAGLEPDTDYPYTVVAGNVSTERLVFHTAPANATTLPDRPITVAMWGDSHYGPTILEGILHRIAEDRPDLIVTAGDMVGDGVNEMEWIDHFLHPLRYLKGSVAVQFPVGNHDHGSWMHFEREDSPPMDARFDPVGATWGESLYAYSFNYGGAHFVFVDPLFGREGGLSCGLVKGTPQYEWLRADLEGARGMRWKILFVHEPPYCETWEGGYYDGEPELRDHLVPLMERFGVDLCVSGHAHTYERGLPHPPYDGETGEGNTVAYLITGGGGAVLDNRKYREWPQIDIPPHRVVPNENFLLNDCGEYYRYHFCTMTIEEHRLACTAHWVRTDGSIVDVLDSFVLRKGVPRRSDPMR